MSSIKLNKNNIYVVDGPDCTGKTTFCETLSKILNIPYYHLTYYSDTEKHINQFKTISNEIKRQINDVNNIGFIVDRYIMSERVYADVYRNSNYFDAEVFNPLWESFINDSDYTTIIALPSNKDEYLNKIYDEISNNREEMYNKDFDKVYDAYRKYTDLIIHKENVQILDIFDKKERNKSSMPDII